MKTFLKSAIFITVLSELVLTSCTSNAVKKEDFAFKESKICLSFEVGDKGCQSEKNEFKTNSSEISTTFFFPKQNSDKKIIIDWIYIKNDKDEIVGSSIVSSNGNEYIRANLDKPYNDFLPGDYNVSVKTDPIDSKIGEISKNFVITLP